MSQFGVALLALSVIALVAAHPPNWDSLKQEHGKQYERTPGEWQNMEVYSENTRIIADQNALHVAGEVSHKMEIHEFSDKPEKRAKRNNFGDLPVKCGPNQEKIDGECHDV